MSNAETSEESLENSKVEDNDTMSGASMSEEQLVEIHKDKIIPLAILVAGLEDFSSWLDLLSPEEVSEILNRYFEAIGQPIETHSGYIDKYLGDGFISVFGLENKVCGHPVGFAVLAALDILEKMKTFNQFLFKKYGREFSIGIGIDWGKVVVGKIGFRNRKELTAIGRPVSRAHSIEKLTRSVESNILVSENAYAEVSTLFHWGEEFKAKLKKENRSITVVRPNSLIRRRYEGGVKVEEY